MMNNAEAITTGAHAHMLAAEAAAQVAMGDWLVTVDEGWRRAMAPHHWFQAGRLFRGALKLIDQLEDESSKKRSAGRRGSDDAVV
jgi:hypothetical protein